jgi:putative hydrolase of the HAD superfamily
MAIFFDLDATLLDHDSAAAAAATKFYETFQDHFDEALPAFLERWDRTAEKYFQSNYLLECTLEEQRRLRIREIFRDPVGDQEADARFQVYLKSYVTQWKLFPDAVPCLKALGGRTLGLITNGDGPGQRAKVEGLGLAPYLSVVIVSREVNLAKPQKAIFELAARQAGMDPGDCVYVGDRLDADALASRAAGMRGIWLDRKGKWDGTDHGVPILQNLGQLPALLGGNNGDQ